DQILEKANQSGDPNAINDAMQQILTKVSPEKQPMAMQILQNKQKIYQEKAEKQKLLQKNQTILRDLEQRRGLEKGSLEPYAEDLSFAEKVTKQPKATQASQPIDPDQIKRIQNVRNTDEFKKSSPAKKYQLLTDAGVSKENAKAEADIFAEEEKGLDKSYEAQKDYIQDITSKYNSWVSETKPRIMQLQNLGDKDLIGPAAAKFLEAFDIP